MGARAGVTVVSLTLVTMWGLSASVSAQAQQANCAGPDAALAQGKLETARGEYLNVLASDRTTECAISGLNRVTEAVHAEEKLCSEGKALAEAGESERARQKYVGALEQNVNSACATAGLESKETDVKKTLGEWSDLALKLLGALGSVIAALLVVCASILLIWTFLKRLLRPTLRIKPFLDGGVEPKLGSGVAALVETQLLSLVRRRGRPEDGYLLDLVVADVEVLASDSDLASAMGGLAEVPQLQLFVGVLSMVDRLVGHRSFVASGELVPPGEEGAGVVLAFHRQDRLESREALWAPPTAIAPLAEPPELDEDEDPPPANEEDDADTKVSPGDFYGLSVRAASWVQYETACSLDSYVRFLTKNAESWSHLATGLDEHRQGDVVAAIDAYIDALAVDPDNVGALVNLSVLIAREFALYGDAIVLLLHARRVLLDRYEEQM
jgi:Flp pilus assembly protein TadD